MDKRAAPRSGDLGKKKEEGVVPFLLAESPHGGFVMAAKEGY